KVLILVTGVQIPLGSPSTNLSQDARIDRPRFGRPFCSRSARERPKESLRRKAGIVYTAEMSFEDRVRWGGIAITGMGCVTPCGNNVAQFWSALIAGRSGIQEITSFDT